MRKRPTSWRSSTPGRNRTRSRRPDSVSNMPDGTADQILAQAKLERAEALLRAYVRREPEAIERVNALLASGGRTLDDLALAALPGKLDDIERIDRLITIAETRRNISLRELDRRRAVLGEALRRKLQDVEDGDFEVIAAAPAAATRPRLAENRGRRRSARPDVDRGGPQVIEV